MTPLAPLLLCHPGSPGKGTSARADSIADVPIRRAQPSVSSRFPLNILPCTHSVPTSDPGFTKQGPQSMRACASGMVTQPRSQSAGAPDPREQGVPPQIANAEPYQRIVHDPQHQTKCQGKACAQVQNPRGSHGCKSQRPRPCVAPKCGGMPVGRSDRSGLVFRHHGDDHVALLVPAVDVPVGLDDLL
jgi:hypothetical protein